MWSPIVTSPLVSAAGLAGMRSPAAARTVLPAAGALYALNGLIGTYTHLRGVARKPGGFSEPTYNLVMGPPLLAPGSLILVGAIAMLAGHRGAGALTVAPDFRRADHLPHQRGRRARRQTPTSCRASAAAARRRCTAAIPTTTCSSRPATGITVTREMVLSRVHEVPAIRFFSAARGGDAERAVRRAHRPGLRAPRIPVINFIDEKYAPRRPRRLPVRRHARRPRRLAVGRPRAGRAGRRAGGSRVVRRRRPERPAGHRRGLRRRATCTAERGTSSTSSAPSAW